MLDSNRQEGVSGNKNLVNVYIVITQNIVFMNTVHLNNLLLILTENEQKGYMFVVWFKCLQKTYKV